MTQAIAATKIFQTRDLFVHDGSHLRRLRVSAPVQLAMLVAMVLLLTWSAYSAIRLFAAPTQVFQTAAPAAVSSDIARLAAATEARVKQIEERQKILAAMIAGEKVDPDVIAKLGYTDALSDNAARGGPFDPATQADPTFKSLFTSWKKLDHLADGAIAVPSDKPVKTAEFTSGYGNLIKLEHGRGIETRYAHLARVLVSPGQRVARGQMIGHMGSTGRSTGSHLHYEVRIDGRAVNPIPFMKSNDYLLAMQKKANQQPMESLA